MSVESDFEVSITELFHKLFGIREEILVPAGSSAAIMRRYVDLRITCPSCSVFFWQIYQVPDISSAKKRCRRLTNPYQ